MIIELRDLGKRYNRNWIFRHINYNFKSGTAYAITGANGSGKSTLLQVLAGAIMLSEGTVIMYTDHNQQATDLSNTNISIEHHHKHLSVAAPYLEVIEEMTLVEFLEFHFQFKPKMPAYDIPDIIEFIQLTSAADRQIRHYSSGMKQRVKLAQAIFSNVPVVLLDEPLTNLDTKGMDLYYQLIDRFCKDRLLIICSNSEPEIHFCKERLAIDQYNR